MEGSLNAELLNGHKRTGQGLRWKEDEIERSVSTYSVLCQSDGEEERMSFDWYSSWCWMNRRFLVC